uniref:RRM domain-containing protein n=1 Tax=Anopheles coluzzii TaxID=1518534 RepID=A0A8W7PY93_ANOCL
MHKHRVGGVEGGMGRPLLQNGCDAFGTGFVTIGSRIHYVFGMSMVNHRNMGIHRATFYSALSKDSKVNGAMVTRTKKIFVGGLSAPTTLEDVKSYFEQFGPPPTRNRLRRLLFAIGSARNSFSLERKKRFSAAQLPDPRRKAELPNCWSLLRTNAFRCWYRWTKGIYVGFQDCDWSKDSKTDVPIE